MTTIVNTCRLASGLNPEKGTPRRPMTYRPPATPANAPEKAKALSLARTPLMENAAAPRALSRTATTTRPARLRRKLRASTHATTNAPRQK